METQALISKEKLSRKIGQELDVLIDETGGEELIGRTYSDAPEIDGLVYIKSETKAELGSIQKVRIDSASEYDLWGTRV